jgi:peptide/nickel transport system substrate-binding protein
VPSDVAGWAPSTAIDDIRVQLYADQTALAKAFQAGEVDAAGGLDPADATRLAALPGVRLVRYPRSVLTAVMLNLRFGRNVFQSVHVRRALLLAIDRDALVAQVLDGLGTRATTLIPPSSWAYAPTSAGNVPHDTSAAVKELRAAGWLRSGAGWLRPGAKGRVTIELLTLDRVTNPVVYAAAAQVAADWKQIGIAVRLTPLTADQIVSQRLVPGTYDAAIVDMNVGLDADLYPLLASTQVLRGGSNLSGYQSTKLDGLLEAARAWTTSQATRQKRLAAVQAELATSLPVLSLVYADYLYLVRSDVQGPAPRLIADPGERYWDVLTWRLAKPAGP